MQTLRFATRRSKLALAQARAYGQQLKSLNEPLRLEELHITTSGDKFQDRPLQALGGKGLFIKEIEEALLDDRADFAVHSIKDVPAELAPGLVIASIPKREDPLDALITASGATLAELPQGAIVGTSSLRRKTMLLRTRPDLDIRPLRGNVDTRLRKLDAGDYDAIVLAAAGLSRLGMKDRITEALSADQCLPAVGQGALGIECRTESKTVQAALMKTDDAETRIRVSAERAFMLAVGGSCQLPVAAFAERRGEDMWLRAMVADADGSKPRFGERTLGWPNEDEAERAGRDLGEALR